MEKKSLIGLAAAAGAAMFLLAGPAHADARVYLNIGTPAYVYTPPAYVYSQPQPVYSPGYVYYGQHQYHNRGYYHGGYRGRDRDRDGIPNRYDRDRDGDGVPNYHDRRPNNYRRY